VALGGAIVVAVPIVGAPGGFADTAVNPKLLLDNVPNVPNIGI
jgi:hypothetical protein